MSGYPVAAQRVRRWGANAVSRSNAPAEAGATEQYPAADSVILEIPSKENITVTLESGGYPQTSHKEPLTTVMSQSSINAKSKGSSSTKQKVLSGYRVKLQDGRTGEVEFVATTGEVLLSLDENGQPFKRPWFEETPREWVEGMWAKQVWALPKEIQIQSFKHQLRERRDVADYRHTLRCLEAREAGLSAPSLAQEIGRPETWIQEAWRRGPPAKPKHLEHWDPRGFCEVRYLKRQYHEPGLYESIVSAVNWQQDRVWRVHKESDGNWELRTVKQCEVENCGRSLQRVPDHSVKIGPKDSAAPKSATPHSNWCCQKKLPGCAKPSLETPLGQNFYWWCPKHRWYVCQECQKEMPDKPTSKQIRGWYRGECTKLDDLVYKVVSDFNLPDPQAPYGGTARYTIKMNWYPDGKSQVTDHRHDVWTILVSLGAPRVLNVDYARVMMEDGDVILFGTQKHGVPVSSPSQGGRLSLVLMFQPDEHIEKAALHLAGHEVPGFVHRPLKTLSMDHYSEEQWSDEEWGNEQRSQTQWGNDEVAALCAMGFSEVEVEQALAACDGDSTVAANLLLANT